MKKKRSGHVQGRRHGNVLPLSPQEKIRNIVCGCIVFCLTLYGYGFIYARVSQFGKGYSLEIANDIPSLFANLNQNKPMLLFGLMICIVFAFYAIKYLNAPKDIDGRRLKFSDKDDEGSARWQTLNEMLENYNVTLPNDPDGMILGKYAGKSLCLPWKPKSYDTSFNANIALFGAPGRRKSRSFMIPAVYQLIEAGYSGIVSDPKGELYEKTYPAVHNAGYTVKVLNLKGGEFKYSNSWNCLQGVTGSEAYSKADMFVNAVLDAASNGDKGAVFWDNGSRNLFKALVLYVACSKSFEPSLATNSPTTSEEIDKHRTLAEVFYLIADCQIGVPEKNKSKDGNESFTVPPGSLMDKFSRLDPDDIAQREFKIFLRAAENNPQIAGQIKYGLSITLGLFLNNDLISVLSEQDIDLSLPGKEKCMYYIVTSDQHSTYEFISSLYFSFQFTTLVENADANPTRELAVPTYFVLDEFANLGNIKGIDRILSTVRSRKIGIILALQSLGQLMTKYDNNVWQTMLNCCDTQLFLGGNDKLTSDYYSDIAGVGTIQKEDSRKEVGAYSVLKMAPRKNISDSSKGRAVISPDEIRRIKPGEVLLFSAANHVLKLKKYDFEEHRLSKEFIPGPDGKPVPRRLTDNEPAWVKKKEKEEYGIYSGDSEELTEGMVATMKAEEKEPEEKVVNNINVEDLLSKPETGELTEEPEEPERTKEDEVAGIIGDMIKPKTRKPQKTKEEKIAGIIGDMIKPETKELAEEETVEETIDDEDFMM